MAHLTFSRPPATSGHLTFGESDGVGGDAVVDGQVTLARPTVAGGVALGFTIGGSSTLGRPTIAGGVRYVSGAARPLVGRVASRFQGAEQHLHGARASYDDARRSPAGKVQRFQDADPIRSAVQGVYEDATKLGRTVGARFQDGDSTRTGLQSGYGDALRTARLRRGVRFQDGIQLGTKAGFPFGLGNRAPIQTRARFQDGQRKPFGVEAPYQAGLRRTKAVGPRYQEAIRPPPGIWVRIPVDPKDPCYLPDSHLTFDVAWDGGAHLTFVCERHDGPGPEPGTTIIVPVRGRYIVKNEVVLTRVDGGAEIPAKAFSMSLDADSWTWQWSATLHGSALEVIEPDSSGEPVDVLAEINGVDYRLCVERYSRERRFASIDLRVTGRGRAAILDAPYAPVLNHAGATDLTIQQLLAKVLEINGVGIGWDVDFELDDWLVPGGTWAHQGTYISGVLDIANASGAIVQPHNTDQTLRMLARYPAKPWEWGDVTPHFELPAAAVAVEGIEWVKRPDYNRIFVTGTTSDGVIGQVTRGGTAGDVLAPMVTHPLITHADGARQRGTADLSNVGRQAMVSLRMQVLPETGIIVPGQFVKYVDGSTERMGLVRSTSLEWSRPSLRQVIGLETHVEA